VEQIDQCVVDSVDEVVHWSLHFFKHFSIFITKNICSLI
jgi:hypothetical protein